MREGGRRKGGGNRGVGGGREAPRSADRWVLQTRAGRFPWSSAVRASALLQQPRRLPPEGAERRGPRPGGRAAGGRCPHSKPPAKSLGLQKQAASSAEQAACPGAERARRAVQAAPRLLVGAGALGAGLGLTMPLRGRAAGHKRIPGLPPPGRARISCSRRPRV